VAQDDAGPVGIGLADAIGQVRAELEKAIAEGRGSAVAFRAGPVQLEFEVAFTQAAGRPASGAGRRPSAHPDHS
jgi:hypothetical protein